MNSMLYDYNSSEDIIKIPEIISNQPLTTTISKDDINMINRFNDSICKKQKSLISIYDNNPQQQTHLLIGIIGENKRSQAFFKRLLLSGFSKPILCNINSNEIKTNYVSYEKFYEYSPNIILITENLSINIQDLFPQTKQQLIIDAREIISSNLLLSSIPGSYQAFGNLSNSEIEYGTERTSVAVEQYVPINLIKFIYDLKCFSRGIFFLDQYSYNNQKIKLFHNYFFSFLLTIIIFSLYLIISIIEYKQKSILIYRQASSITGLTSITLLSLLILIKPLIILIEFIYSIIIKEKTLNSNFIQQCLHSRCYLSWYSLFFGLLHLLFILFSKIDFNSNHLIYPFFFGLFTLILLFILSFVYFPWISKHLLYKEYYYITFYLSPFCFLFAFIHQWKLQFELFSLTLIFPLFVLILYLIIYSIQLINKIISLLS